MPAKPAKLSYIAAQFRVRAELTPRLCSEYPHPPASLCERVRAKFEELKARSEVHAFSVYPERLQEFWRRCATAENLPSDQVLSLVLGEGCPLYKGLRVSLSTSEEYLAELSIDAADPSVIKAWRLEPLVYYINHGLAELGSTQKVNPAQVHSAWLKAAAGDRVTAFALGALPVPPTDLEKNHKPYSLIAHKGRKDLSLVVRDIDQILESLGLEKMLALVKKAATTISEQFGCEIKVLYRDLNTGLQQAAAGSERLGMDLPLVLLAGMGALRPAIQSVDATHYPGAGKLELTISEDGMEASVTSGTAALYDDSSFKMNLTWLQSEVKRYGIHLDLCQAGLNEIQNRIARREPFDGVILAVGTKSKGGAKPYLHMTYKEAQQVEANEGVESPVDLRNLQQRAIVNPGQLIAELRFQEPPIMGSDVFGRPLPPAPDAPLNIQLREGIIEKSPGFYFAESQGIPVINRDAFYLSKNFVHDGDVNLRSGNIFFDGSVEIIGSIDSGAIVYVKGDLKVRNSIRNAFVRCGGSIEVRHGITTSDKGRVAAKKNIKADFIENSNIQCGGSLVVNRVLINSNLVVGGRIETLDKTNGVIAGGIISCRHNLSTGHLAFKNGSMTRLNVGVSWKAELAVRLREARLSRVKAIQAKERQALREVLARHKNQMTPKHEYRKLFYQQRLIKVRPLIERMEAHLEHAKSQLVYDNDVKIFIHQTMFSNIAITMGGKQVTVLHDIAGVILLGKSKHGTNMIPIEAIDAEDEAAQAPLL